MKQVYQTLLTASVLATAGAMQASADFWSVSINDDAVTADNIVEGAKYIFQTASSAKGGGAWYLSGAGYRDKNTGFTNEAVFSFEKAGEKIGDNEVYYIKNLEGDYVARPGSAKPLTKQKERAWKVMVVEPEYHDANKEYTHVEEGKDPVKYKGINAYIQEAKDGAGDGTELDLSKMTFINPDNAPGELLIVEARKQGETEETKYNQYRFLMSYNPLSIGQDYNQNGWILRPAQKMDAKEALQTAMTEVVPEGKTMEEQVKVFPIGTGSGQYSQEKLQKLMDFWNKAQGIVDGKVNATDAEIAEIITQLKPKYEEFTTNINPLVPGYYIFTNWRGEKEAGYDGAALYDGRAVNYNSNILLWSGKPGDGVDYNATDEVSYNMAKFVWEVIPSGKDGKFYFRNLETGRYIGKQSANSTPIPMVDEMEETFSIGANPDAPGFLTFYSEDFPRSNPAYYGGIHAQVAAFHAVPWSSRALASSWHARTLSTEEVEKLKALIAQPKRNAHLKSLVTAAKGKFEGGKLYFPVNEKDERLDEVLNGKFGDVDGIVTSKDQLDCPMADPDEGKDLGVFFDKDLTNYFHSTWHGGENAWNGGHFLQMKLNEAVNTLVFKWGERNVGNAQNGAPKVVRLWGATSEEALTKNKVQKVGDDGQPVEGQYNYDAWKKDSGWEELTVGQFDYSTKMLNAEGQETGRKVGLAALSFDKPYKYFRLEVVTKANGATGWFYGAELRVYKGKYDSQNSPLEAVPADVRKELKEILATADQELKAEKATDETIEKLQKAYDKFRENYPDPTRVTEVTDIIKKRLEKADEGAKLGYYAVGAKEELKTASEKIEAELKAITDKRPVTVQEINNFVAALNAALATFESKLQMPQDGIYMIESQSMHKHVIGNVIALRSTSTDTYDQVCFAGREKIEGQEAYQDTKDRKQHLDYLWKVEKVDGGYTFRNLFSGLYLARKAGKNGNAIMQSVEPYVIKVEFINFPGAFRFVVSDGKDKNEHRFVNAQPASATIVTWNSAEGNDNSAFSFIPVQKDQLDDIMENGLKYNLKEKTGYQIVTLPITVEVDDATGGKFYTVLGQKADTKDIVLKEAKELKAGQAYVFAPNKDNDGTVLLYPSVKSVDELKPVHTPAEAVNGLFGTFEFIELRQDNGVFSPDRDKVVLTEEKDKAAANAGYFGKMPVTTEAGDLVIPANQIVTLIKSVVNDATSSKTKGTFTLSGVRVDDVNQLPAGIYVINGHKVVVK